MSEISTYPGRLGDILTAYRQAGPSLVSVFRRYRSIRADAAILNQLLREL